MESAAIVVLERLAHTDPDLLPDDLRLARFEFSEPVLETKVEEFAALPANWNQDENAMCHIVSQWRRLASRRAAPATGSRAAIHPPPAPDLTWPYWYRRPLLV